MQVYFINHAPHPEKDSSRLVVTGWFGDKCQYKCHCASTCDTSGDCVDNKCSPGWFGYKCQYRDLMDLSKLESNKLIIDHNDETCQLLDNDYILITWDEPKVFTWLRIVVKNKITVPLTDLKIWYKKYRKIEGQFLPCQNQRFFLINSRTIDVWCDFNETFQMLKLTEKVNFSICTLNVNGGRNVALKQSTAQSSTYMSPKYKKDVSQSSNAVDGKLDVKYFTFKEGSCARTALGDNNSFWSVQFLPHRITEYVLYGRRDSDNLFGFTLTTFPKTDKSLTFENTVKEQSKIYKIVDPRKNLVSNVTITRKTVLKFCEVEIYGECPSGTWGLACTNCSQHCPKECHVEDGRCFKLCLGFTNPPFCDLPFYKTHCGINCTKQCSNNCNNSECEPKTGECLKCKLNGTFSGYCDKTCVNTTWGENCTQRCSDTCRNKECNSITGQSTKECLPTYFGSNCKTKCSTQCSENICDSKTGKCLNCLPGYTGDLCNIICDSRHYGQNCSRTCSPSCMDQLCDRHDGHCLMCNNTLYGKQCDEKCPRHCLNETCDVYTGKCLACKPDYVGDFCDTTENTLDQTAAVAVGVSVGAVVLTFLVIGAAVAVYKRRVKKEKVESKVARNDVAKSENVEHYNKTQDDNYQDVDSVHDQYETMSCVGGLQMESKESQFEMVSFDNQDYSNETYQNVRIKRM